MLHPIERHRLLAGWRESGADKVEQWVRDTAARLVAEERERVVVLLPDLDRCVPRYAHGAPDDYVRTTAVDVPSSTVAVYAVELQLRRAAANAGLPLIHPTS